jgi:hypothetical protein
MIILKLYRHTTRSSLNNFPLGKPRKIRCQVGVLYVTVYALCLRHMIHIISVSECGFDYVTKSDQTPLIHGEVGNKLSMRRHLGEQQPVAWP